MKNVAAKALSCFPRVLSYLHHGLAQANGVESHLRV